MIIYHCIILYYIIYNHCYILFILYIILINVDDVSDSNDDNNDDDIDIDDDDIDSDDDDIDDDDIDSDGDDIDDDDIDIDDDDIASPALIKRSWATTVRKVLQSPLPKTPLGKFIRTLSSRKSKTVDCHNSKFCLFYHSRSDDDSGDILSYINVF